jgi:hypothetical protein
VKRCPTDDSGFGIWDSGFGTRDSGFGIRDLGFGTRDLGFGVRDSIGAALLTAAVSTMGDYLWANVLPHHRPVYGLMHGALLFMTVGVCLGAAARKPLAGAIGGASIGFVAAGSFYLLQPFIGYSALFVLFTGLWVALGLLNGRVLQRRDSMRAALGRGALAAVGSGLGFYAISGIWFPFNPRGWDYAVHFGYWAIAYLPGFAALLVRARREVAL